MTESWQWPVEAPLFTDSLIREVIEENEKAGPKPKAFDTLFRYSGLGCTRRMAYEVLHGSELLDPASTHVAFVGTQYHELLQGALQRRYPQAEVEVKSVLRDIVSGHCDALVDVDGTLWLYELKTKSTIQFDMASGVMRKGWKRGSPKGPSYEVILQAGMNARALGADSVAIGYVCFENYSVGLAEKVGLRQMDRFLAEWHVPYDVWSPMVEAELQRLRDIETYMREGWLPDRESYIDTEPGDPEWGGLERLAPEAQRPHWRCTYCPFKLRCEEDGPGMIQLRTEASA